MKSEWEKRKLQPKWLQRGGEATEASRAYKIISSFHFIILSSHHMISSYHDNLSDKWEISKWLQYHIIKLSSHHQIKKIQKLWCNLWPAPYHCQCHFNQKAVPGVEGGMGYHDVSVDRYGQDVEHWGLSIFKVVLMIILTIIRWWKDENADARMLYNEHWEISTLKVVLMLIRIIIIIKDK